MSAEDKNVSDPHKSRWYITVGKILFFVLAFLVVIFTVLANIKGNSDPFREAVEQYMSGATGYHARVGQLNHASLFPTLMFDFEDLALFEKEGDSTPVASVEEVLIKVAFIDIVIGNGKFKDIHIEGVRALPGVMLPRTVVLSALTIEDREDGTAAIKADGSIGDDPFYAQSDIDVFGTGKKIAYGFGGKRHIKAGLGALKASTDIDDGKISDLKLTLSDKDVLTGHLKMSDERRGLGIKGELKLAGKGSVITPDLLLSSAKLKGKLTSPAFYIEDVGSESLLKQSINEVQRVLGDDGKSDSDIGFSRDMNVLVDIKEFYVGKGSLGSLSLPVKVNEGALSIPLAGKFAEGDLSGHIKLDTKEMPAVLDFKASLNHLDYGALQKRINEAAEVTGQGDLVLSLKSKGRTVDDLMKGINGTAVFIGGKGRFRSGAINLWGGGLINAIMPDVTPEDELGVNCAIMDFKIEEGIAKAETLFLDGTHVTLAGEGSYNIVEDNLDLSIKPKPKEIALGNVGGAINITGPIGNPSIGPSLLDFGAGIGKLLLSAVNPAFLALSLADLGLNEEHPCAAFMGTPPEHSQKETPEKVRDSVNQ